MRLVIGSVSVLALGLGLAAGVPAAPAHAQMAGMNCFTNAGGRTTCVESYNSMVDRLNTGAADRHADEIARQRKLVRKIAQAVHDGHCTEALELALTASDPAIAANTARLCGVPEADAAAVGPPKS